LKPCLINDRWEILLPEHRANRKEWPWWEKERLASMFETTKKGDRVFYVGAEVGDMAALLAKWGAEMYLFEPNEKAWPQIKAIWEANNLISPAVAWQGFISDKTDPKNQLLDGSWPESASGPIVSDHGFKELADPGEQPQLKIDDIGVSPDMITLDVEGAEGRVLRGAEGTLRKHHPRIYLSLHYEFMYRIYNELWFELCEWIRGLGYKEVVLGNQPHEGHILYVAE